MIIANNLRITNTNVLIPIRVKMRGEWGMGNGGKDDHCFPTPDSPNIFSFPRSAWECIPRGSASWESRRQQPKRTR